MNNEKHFQNMLSRWFLSAVTAIAICPAISAQTAIEYFWNEDPGIGHGTVVYQTGYDNTGSDFTIDASNLKQGLNLLGLRATQRGKWSPTSYRLVAIRDDSSEDWKAEYFWNDDPGVWNGTQISASGFDDKGKEFSLDTSSLPHGINLLGLRVNCQGEWSYTSYRMIAVGMDTPDTWNVEYFWNNDPGIGKGTQLSASTSDANGSEFSIDTTQLPQGINLLGLRVNSQGQTSYTSYRMVAVGMDTPDKWKAEYFWNDDPGVGKATSISLSAPDSDNFMSMTLDTSKLRPGLNILGIRANSGAALSATRTYIINISPAGDDKCVVEYFWDYDPGCGKATKISNGSIEAGTLVEVDIPYGWLKPGAHTLGIRSLSSYGWSPTYTNQVFIAGEKGAGCTYAEYFWGEDPGYGNGTPIDINPGDEVSVEDLTIDFPTEVADEYVLSFRSRSDNGWSTTVTKILPHLYVQEITVEADTTVMVRGTTMQLRSIINPADAFDDRITWSSSDESIIIVDQNGNVTAKGAGKATVTATAADGSGTSGSIDLEVIVPVEAITIEPSEINISVTKTYLLKAKVMPEDASYTDVVWSSEGEAVTVDEEGNITAISRGDATVTATSTDGSNISGSCKVTVGYLMGDADDDGTLAVNDVVLTARGVVDDIDTKLVKEAVDMNYDNLLTVGDLTLVVKSVLEWIPSPISIQQQRVAPEYGNVRLLAEPDGETVMVYVESGIGITGLQFDAEVSEGMSIARITADANIGHTVENHSFSDGTMRMLSYSSSNKTMPIGVPLARIHLVKNVAENSDEATLEVKRVLVSDLSGNLYPLGTAWTSLETSSTPELRDDKMSVTAEGRTIIVTVPDDRNVMFTDMKGISRRMAMTKGINKFDVPTGGVYAVDGIKIIIK